MSDNNVVKEGAGSENLIFAGKPLTIDSDLPRDGHVSFNYGGKEVGTFDMSTDKPTFTGDVDASAQVFVDFVILHLKTRISGERSHLLRTIHEMRQSGDYDADTLTELHNRVSEIW